MNYHPFVVTFNITKHLQLLHQNTISTEPTAYNDLNVGCIFYISKIQEDDVQGEVQSSEIAICISTDFICIQGVVKRFKEVIKRLIKSKVK